MSTSEVGKKMSCSDAGVETAREGSYKGLGLVSSVNNKSEQRKHPKKDLSIWRPRVVSV